MKTKLLTGDKVRYSLNRAPVCFRVSANEREATLRWPAPILSPKLHYHDSASVIAEVGILKSSGFLTVDTEFSKLFINIIKFPPFKKKKENFQKIYPQQNFSSRFCLFFCFSKEGDRSWFSPSRTGDYPKPDRSFEPGNEARTERRGYTLRIYSSSKSSR